MADGARSRRAGPPAAILAAIPAALCAATLAGCVATDEGSGQPFAGLRAFFAEVRPAQVAELPDGGGAVPAVASPPPAAAPPTAPGPAVAQAQPEPPRAAEADDAPPGPRVSRMAAVERTQLHAGPEPGAPAAGEAARGEVLVVLRDVAAAPETAARLPVLRGGAVAWVDRAAVESAYARRVDAFGIPRHAGGDRFVVAGVEVVVGGIATAGPLAEARIDAHLEARDRAVACRVFDGLGRCEFADGSDLGFELLREGLVQATGQEYAALARFAGD
jgi:hypothetical protein